VRLDQAALPLAVAVALAAVSVVGTDLVQLNAASAEADQQAAAAGRVGTAAAVVGGRADGSATPAALLPAATLSRKPAPARAHGTVRTEVVRTPTQPAPTYVDRSLARSWAPAAPAPTQPLAGETVRVGHANIKVGTSTFATDLATVLESGPDFVTLNEVADRSDSQLRPPGYQSYRSMEHTYSRETPVLWRTDRWTLVDSGTRWLTTRKVKWGERAVNWVTVRSTRTGATVSVVSAHAAPTTHATAGLLPIFAQGLSELVGELKGSGPVLVGGDLNAHYTSASYPRALLSAGGLSATFDTFGIPAGGTGDHRGGTIDYLLHTTGLRPTAQSTAELASDHDALFGTFVLDAVE
jgi:endonuclease/exonuclease/phosphatase (EEP) superfamily protein YafD